MKYNKNDLVMIIQRQTNKTNNPNQMWLYEVISVRQYTNFDYEQTKIFYEAKAKEEKACYLIRVVACPVNMEDTDLDFVSVLLHQRHPKCYAKYNFKKGSKKEISICEK